jgi:hypothetical protein
VAVSKQPTEMLSACEQPFNAHFLTGVDQVIFETLMIPCVMVVAQNSVIARRFRDRRAIQLNQTGRQLSCPRSSRAVE